MELGRLSYTVIDMAKGEGKVKNVRWEAQRKHSEIGK